MSHPMKFFVIYDNLYEEYQVPFVMKNINIAKIEFAKFVEDCVSKAPEKEKQATASRFTLFFFPDLEYDNSDNVSCVIRDITQLKNNPFLPIAIPLEADMSTSEVDSDE